VPVNDRGFPFPFFFLFSPFEVLFVFPRVALAYFSCFPSFVALNLIVSFGAQPDFLVRIYFAPSFVERPY